MSDTLEGRAEVRTKRAGARLEFKVRSLVRRATRPGVRLALLAVLPAIAAIWVIPGFMTQDGPAHLYNSHVMLNLLSQASGSPFARALALRLQPFPNWSGHLCAMTLLTILPAQVVGRLMATLTLAGVAAAAMWLRTRVLGLRHPYVGALTVAIVATNFPWLLGFWSFLLGVIACLATWGIAWGHTALPMPDWDQRRGARVAALLVVGYFCHPVSLAVTVGGLCLMASAAPRRERRRRLLWTALVTAPVVPLLAWYLLTTRGQAGFQLVYENLKPALSPQGWLNQLRWVDPITLGSRQELPFVSTSAAWFLLISPVVALGLAFYLARVSRWYGAKAMVMPLALSLRPAVKQSASCEARSLWPWWALAVGLMIAGVVAPDTLGLAHGNYLPQRFLLMGLLTAAVLLDVSWATITARRYAWLCTAALAWALLVQTSFVWDYGFNCNHVAGTFGDQSRQAVGRGHRVAALLIDTDKHSKFRVNPLMHADTLLGIDAGNVVWSDYELAHYYFPIRTRPGVPHPPADEFEAIGKLQDPRDFRQRAIRWRNLLETTADSIDRLVTRGSDEHLDTITAEYFVLSRQTGDPPVRVWKRPMRPGLLRQTR